MLGEEKADFNQNILQVVEQVSKIYDMTVAQQKERQMKAEGLSNDMATSGSDGYLRYPVIYVLEGNQSLLRFPFYSNARSGSHFQMKIRSMRCYEQN